ncbi:glucosyltransferase domain-containing protein [Butyrivibrio sp. AE3004]|uniref:glucosyltransferase domain-containing protein n=1 Tax=Butyrivibrio sp. AE3004 TaxID=1506994 RepID=UPI00049427FC|nr:glucosyltransferase domain-containing protein [Butyrivibrio sp. AE3004]
MGKSKLDKNIIIDYILTLVIVIFAYQGFYRFGFGSDTMIHYLNPLINIESEFTYGRYIPYLMEMLFYKLGIILPEKYRYFFILHIFVVSLGAFIYQQVIISLLNKKKVFSDIFEEYFGRVLLLLPFISTLFSEYLMFPECFVYCFYVLFTALALYFYSKNKYVAAVFFMLMGGCTYQVSVILCAIYTLLYILVEGDCVLNKKMFFRGLIVSVSCLLSGFLNYESTKLMLVTGVMSDNPKPITSGSVFDSVTGVIRLFWNFLKNGIGLLPVPYINLCILIIVTLMLLISRKTEKERILTFVFGGFVMFALSLAIPIIQSSAPRVIYTLYAALGCTCFLAYIQLDIKTKKYMKALIGICAIVQLFSCQQIALNHYISNVQDLACAQAVLNKIDNYEADTGVTVTEIGVCVDDESLNYYDNVYYKLDQINERTARNVAYSLLEYAGSLEKKDELNGIKSDTGRRFKKSQMKAGKIRKKYFKDKNWDKFDVDKQLVIDKNTAYWCIY